MSFGAAIGWLAGSLLRIRRRHVEHAMTRAGVANVRAAAKAMYRSLGIALVELLRTRGAVTIDDAAFDRAGPIVLFASHTGNWELAAAAAARKLAPRRLYVVAKPMHSAFIERMLSDRRARLGVEVIRPAGALAAVGAALARGDVVAMPIDQVPDRESQGVWTTFLGAPALVDRAPAAVTWRARATALVVANGRVIDVIPPPAETDGRAWIDRAALRATTALERFIHAEPSSWLWLHRRWRPALTQATSRG